MKYNQNLKQLSYNKILQIFITYILDFLNLKTILDLSLLHETLNFSNKTEKKHSKYHTQKGLEQLFAFHFVTFNGFI
jgi:hypothetical protein